MIYVFFYKIICLILGAFVIFLGYKLFIKGLYNESGDVEGSWKEFKVIVRRAAAGTYFVLFGSLIIGVTILKGLSNDDLTVTKAYNYPPQPSRIDSIKPIDTIKIH